MIYTVTFNPSLDYIVSVDDFKLGLTNRTNGEQILPGGKGINVSTVLHNLGIKNTALGFIAGFTGQEIKQRIEAIGCGCDFIELKEGLSRINIKLKSIDGTEINGRGPDITESALHELYERFDKLGNGDTLVLAGSIPESISDSVYRDIMLRLSDRGIRFVVDATNKLLLNVLDCHPFLIKPNNHELGEIFNVELTTKNSVVEYAEKLKEMGAQNVLVSMGGEGAVLLDADGNIHMQEAPEGKLINAVGAGDSMVAGFLAGYEESKDYGHAFKMAVSAGSASAFSELLATKDEIMDIYNKMQ